MNSAVMASGAAQASGPIVTVEPKVFVSLLSKADHAIVVVAERKIFKITYRYLTAYGGFVFFTKAHDRLMFPGGVELISAKSFWVPGEV